MAESPAGAVGSRRPLALVRWAIRGVALLSGVGAAFAHPPWSFYPGLLGYSLFFVLVDRAGPQQRKSAFLRGWLAGCGYFLVSLNWLVDPFFVDAKEQAWMAPIAVAAVDMGMALFWGAAAWVYRAGAGKGVARVLLFAGALAAAEWLRGHILTGFPWDLPGETWPAGSPLSQGAAAVGAYGLTWITLVLATAPALLVEGRRGLLAVAAVGIAATALWAAGAQRLDHARVTPGQGPWVRIVQADVRQETKYDLDLFRSILSRYVSLTARPAPHRPAIVIWPEGAIPAAFGDYLAPGAWTEEAVAQALQPGQILIVGGYRWAKSARGADVAYNSLAVLRGASAGLEQLGVYDKYRLVPFGEFMPLDGVASKFGVKQFVHVGDGFVPGRRPAPLRIAGMPVFQPLICYESLFPGFTREGAARAGVRPAVIVNISNDAWFGAGSGPRQHLNIASYRAIEEGLPMVRATPTGLSAVIDAYGRIQPGAFLGEGAFGDIDAPLPAALAPTLFDRWGEWAFVGMLLASLVGANWVSTLRRRAQ